MNILTLFKNKAKMTAVWKLIEPFILKLVEKNVPNWVTKLYENLAKYSQPAIESLFKLKEKIKESPTAVDNYCFNQGVNALDAFANYLIRVVADLRK